MKQVVFAEVVYTVGAWALSYLVNGDESGLEDKEQALIDRWLADATSAFTDDDGQRWVYTHDVVDTDSRTEFGYDEITGLRGDVYTVTMLFEKGEQS